ncbi:MAG TPA: extracellular solute-binding protein [Candidatus Limiplasma sp.]|nr:extracellular solute-binding protein [Candidatus Limiplasma sp.]HRX08324.1 extracellular solute-binding protein [Candidatus Limiplasma sp.]
MKKIVALVLSMMLLVALLPSVVAVAADKRVVKVASWDVYGSAANYHEAIKAGFEAANPDIEIEWVDLASQEYATLAGSMLSAGDQTDVFIIKEIKDLQNWTEQGFLVSLDDMVATDAYDLTGFAGMDEVCRVADGSLNALPFRSDFWVLYYNKDLFDKAGVAYPTGDMTWDEYADLARQMTSGEGIDKIYGTHYHTWLSAVVNWAVCGVDYTLADGNYDPLKYFYELNHALEDEGVCMEYGELKAAGLHYSAAFYQGNIAMLPMGSWLIGTLIKEKANGTFDFDFSFTSVPHMDGVAAKSSFGNMTAMALSKNATNAADAWTFLKWVCGEEGAKAIAAVGTRPAYVSDAVAAAFSSVAGFPSDEGALDALLPSSVSLEWPPGVLVPQLQTIVNEEHTGIMSRESTIDEGIAMMNERAAEVLGN